MIRKTLTLLIFMAALLTACQPAQPAAQPTAAPTAVMTEEMMEPTEEMMEPTDDMMEAAPTEEPMMEETPTEEMMAETEEPMMEETPTDDMMEPTDDMMGDMTPTTFVIRIENTDQADGLTLLSPGAYELNEHPVAFFTPGEADRGVGLESLAEDGDPTALVDTINQMMAGDMMGFMSAVFNTPVGASGPGAAGPGSAYEFTVEAHPGQYLTFATMFIQSNDWFFSPGPDGIALFDADGHPISGDLTDQIFLWDAGTETNQTPGEGADQGPRQSGPNTGEAENGVVTQVTDFNGYSITVTITPQQ